MNKQWYVLHVRTGDETAVKDLIKRDIASVDALAPRRIMRERKNGDWKNVMRTVFQGYVFIRCFMNTEMYYKVSGLPGVIKIMRGAYDSPAPVPEEEMKFVLRFVKDDDWGMSDIIMEGDNIKVISGPLEGYEGQIVKVNKRNFRARVKFTLMGQEKFIDLGINVVEKKV